MRQLQIEVANGPAQGMTQYYAPLPKTLVIPTDRVWHDYTRMDGLKFGKQKPNRTPIYCHSITCHCWRSNGSVLAW